MDEATKKRLNRLLTVLKFQGKTRKDWWAQS